MHVRLLYANEMLLDTVFINSLKILCCNLMYRSVFKLARDAFTVTFSDRTACVVEQTSRFDLLSFICVITIYSLDFLEFVMLLSDDTRAK